MLSFSSIEAGIYHLLYDCRQNRYRSAGEDWWTVSEEHGATHTTDNAYGGLDVSAIIERYAADACDAEVFNLWYESVLPEIMNSVLELVNKE